LYISIYLYSQKNDS